MAQVLIRNIDDEVVEILRQRAQRQHRSLEAELRTILESAAGRGTAREETVLYGRVEQALSKVTDSSVRFPVRTRRPRLFEPIKVKGDKTLSEMLIEDRR